uniref:Basic tail secreted protein n=1 Tax=Rhipicephalus zambeziensis TaxID=60191 RepID=A0A224Y1P9_9ACAR
MMIKHGCVVMLLSVIIKLSHSEQNLTIASVANGEFQNSSDHAIVATITPATSIEETSVEEENSEQEGVTVQSTNATTEEPHIAHGCPTAEPLQVGIKDCSYYCRYVPENNTWLYGFYRDGIYCWADDADDDKEGLPGLCLDGICYPLEHENVTHVPTPADNMLG